MKTVLTIALTVEHPHPFNHDHTAATRIANHLLAIYLGAPGPRGITMTLSPIESSVILTSFPEEA